MTKLARDVMTPDPACCTPNTTLDDVAKMMARNDCGEIPVIDLADQLIGVVTDRDIVCRIVAKEKDALSLCARDCMSSPVVTMRPGMLSCVTWICWICPVGSRITRGSPGIIMSVRALSLSTARCAETLVCGYNVRPVQYPNDRISSMVCSSA